MFCRSNNIYLQKIIQRHEKIQRYSKVTAYNKKAEKKQICIIRSTIRLY